MASESKSSTQKINLKYTSAPMVNQSDYAFRSLVARHGATCVYTQMFLSDRLVSDREYREYHLRDLQLSSLAEVPVVGQISGNDIETLVQAARIIQPYVNAIDLNLGCPQEHALLNTYGAYLLPRTHWPLLSQILTALTTSLTPPLPISTKIRLCQPNTHTDTLALAQLLQNSGASWITLHARTVSMRRRRCGEADLGVVKTLKEGLEVPVVSNGNVRCWEDLKRNLRYTGADGIMVGETLLGNPFLFESDELVDPIKISLEYLSILSQSQSTYQPTLPVIQTHIRHFVEFQCARQPWYPNFRSALSKTTCVEDIKKVLEGKVRRWRGPAGRGRNGRNGRGRRKSRRQQTRGLEDSDGHNDSEEEEEEEEESLGLAGLV